MKVVVTGSFNGQDSLGDECLLKAVVDRIRHQRPDAEIAVQLHGVDTQFIRDLGSAQQLHVEQGLQSVIWKTSSVLQRCRLPGNVADLLANKSVRAASAMNAFGGRAAVDTLRKSDAFFVYGGTQFSGMWFAINAPAYLTSAEIVRKAGGRVFFGPQQFGPMAEADAASLRCALANVANDWRTRNCLDLDLLGSPAEPDREIYDEVFSATRVYPSLAPDKATHILINLRHTTFDTNNVMEEEQYRSFATLVDWLIDHYKLPVIFFGVSGSSFCDDDAAFAAVQNFARNAALMESVGRVSDEYHLFELARRAMLTVSMSFHGCILSAIAGSPMVPITEGKYYDYKYVGFDKYTGNQEVPLISLSDCDPLKDLARITAYVARFDRDRIVETRKTASQMADAFYKSALGR